MTQQMLIYNLVKTGAMLFMFFMIMNMVINYCIRKSKPKRVQVIEFMPTVNMVGEEAIDDVMILWGDSEEEATMVINYLPKIVPVD